MIVRTTVALGVAFVLIVAPAAASQIPDDKLIVPGQRIGKWALEMTLDQFLQMNGPIPRVSRTTGPDIAASDPWAHCWNSQEVCVTTFGRDSQRIEGISTAFDSYATDKSISVGRPTREDVVKAYGQPTGRAVYSSEFVTLVYDTIGLATVLQNDLVVRIRIFRPGAAKQFYKF